MIAGVRSLSLLALVAAGCSEGALPLSGIDAALPPDLIAPGIDLAAGGPACRTVELRFTPGAPGLQIAAWIEDGAGSFVDTLYVTRATARYGLANRPGAALLKTDFKWPYGRREMVLPVWAHRRGHLYPRIVMGGVCGNSATTLCPDGTPCAGDCDDTTIVYHARVSSYEPYYCSPSGASPIDAMSCASRGQFSKGAFADGATSLYPPRADMTTVAAADSPELARFAGMNDLAAVSQATPPAGAPVEPPASWDAHQFPDGEYVAWIELSQESDFNASHDYPNQDDSTPAWNFEGHAFLGQPSVLFAVPFHLSPAGDVAAAADYAGYGAWDGQDGTLRPPDGTISEGVPGSGAGRLLEVTDGTASYRVQVAVGRCP
jgi:hypothetical protein